MCIHYGAVSHLYCANCYDMNHTCILYTFHVMISTWCQLYINLIYYWPNLGLWNQMTSLCRNPSSTNVYEQGQRIYAYGDHYFRIMLVISHKISTNRYLSLKTQPAARPQLWVLKCIYHFIQCCIQFMIMASKSNNIVWQFHCHYEMTLMVYVILSRLSFDCVLE